MSDETVILPAVVSETGYPAAVEAESLYRLLFLEGRDPIFWADAATGEIINCNPAAEALLGRPREEIVGSHQTSLHPTAEAEKYSVGFKDHAARPRADETLSLVQRTDGSTVPVHIMTSRVVTGGRTIIQGTFRDMSDLQKARGELAQRDEYFRDFIEKSPDLAVRIDETGKIVYANGQTVLFFGLTPAECLGRSAFDFILPDDRGPTEEWFAQSVADRVGIGTIENTQVDTRGRKRVCHWTCSFHYDSAGSLRGVSGIARDITRDRELELEVTRRGAAQEIMLHILKGYTSGARVVDLAREAVRAVLASRWFAFSERGAFYVADPENPSLFRLQFAEGFPEGERWICSEVEAGKCFCGEAVAAREIWFSPAWGPEHCSRHPESPGFAHYCCPVVHGGVARAMVDIYLPQGSEDHGKATDFLESLTGTLAICMAHEEASSKLRESTELYRNLVESLREIYYFFKVGTDGKVVYVSPSIERVLGLSPEFVIGTHFSKLPVEDDLQEGLRVFSDLMAGVARYDISIKLKHADGSVRQVSLSAWPDFDKSGRVASISGVGRDTTFERAQAQALSDSLREKEVLLRELHHRVKNNMQIIQSLARMQARKANSPEAVMALDEIGARVRAIALIHEAVYGSEDLSRITLWDYLDRLVRHMRDAFNRPGVAISLGGERSALTLDIDTAVTVGLSVNELVSNAAKHAFPGDSGGNITILVGSQASGEPTVTVSDDGIGFDLTEWKSVTPGKSSFGLYMVRHMVETQLRGRLEVSTHRGTTWKIVLDLSRGAS